MKWFVTAVALSSFGVHFWGERAWGQDPVYAIGTVYTELMSTDTFVHEEAYAKALQLGPEQVVEFLNEFSRQERSRGQPRSDLQNSHEFRVLRKLFHAYGPRLATSLLERLSPEILFSAERAPLYPEREIQNLVATQLLHFGPHLVPVHAAGLKAGNRYRYFHLMALASLGQRARSVLPTVVEFIGNESDETYRDRTRGAMYNVYAETLASIAGTESLELWDFCLRAPVRDQNAALEGLQDSLGRFDWEGESPLNPLLASLFGKNTPGLNKTALFTCMLKAKSRNVNLIPGLLKLGEEDGLDDATHASALQLLSSIPNQENAFAGEIEKALFSLNQRVQALALAAISQMSSPDTKLLPSVERMASTDLGTSGEVNQKLALRALVRFIQLGGRSHSIFKQALHSSRLQSTALDIVMELGSHGRDFFPDLLAGLSTVSENEDQWIRATLKLAEANKRGDASQWEQISAFVGRHLREVARRGRDLSLWEKSAQAILESGKLASPLSPVILEIIGNPIQLNERWLSPMLRVAVAIGSQETADSLFGLFVSLRNSTEGRALLAVSIAQLDPARGPELIRAMEDDELRRAYRLGLLNFTKASDWIKFNKANLRPSLGSELAKKITLSELLEQFAKSTGDLAGLSSFVLDFLDEQSFGDAQAAKLLEKAALYCQEKGIMWVATGSTSRTRGLVKSLVQTQDPRLGEFVLRMLGQTELTFVAVPESLQPRAVFSTFGAGLVVENWKMFEPLVRESGALYPEHRALLDVFRKLAGRQRLISALAAMSEAKSRESQRKAIQNLAEWASFIEEGDLESRPRALAVLKSRMARDVEVLEMLLQFGIKTDDVVQQVGALLGPKSELKWESEKVRAVYLNLALGLTVPPATVVSLYRDLETATPSEELIACLARLGDPQGTLWASYLKKVARRSGDFLEVSYVHLLPSLRGVKGFSYRDFFSRILEVELSSLDEGSGKSDTPGAESFRHIFDAIPLGDQDVAALEKTGLSLDLSAPVGRVRFLVVVRALLASKNFGSERRIAFMRSLRAEEGHSIVFEEIASSHEGELFLLENFASLPTTQKQRVEALRLGHFDDSELPRLKPLLESPFGVVRAHVTQTLAQSTEGRALFEGARAQLLDGSEALRHWQHLGPSAIPSLLRTLEESTDHAGIGSALLLLRSLNFVPNEDQSNSIFQSLVSLLVRLSYDRMLTDQDASKVTEEELIRTFVTFRSTTLSRYAEIQSLRQPFKTDFSLREFVIKLKQRL